MTYLQLLAGTALLIGASAQAQPAAKPKSTSIQLTVMKQVSSNGSPLPFGSVGKFSIAMSDTPIEKACPSNSSTTGFAFCKLDCDPDDATPITLIVRAPGADRVPGYEAPVSEELSLTGCQPNRGTIAFVYKTLDIALAELLKSSPQVARAVIGPAPSWAGNPFAALRPFDQAAPALKQLAAAREPGLERFSRIMRDAELSPRSPSAGEATPWNKPAADYSTGTRSILLNSAATRSLGADASIKLTPITKDPLTLYKSRVGLASELQKKPTKSPFDLALEAELRRTTPSTTTAKEAEPMDWRAIERAHPYKIAPAAKP
ncbi:MULTISPECIES: hypothetical protein [unclassified Rhizobacter]|uniref:hypothetical protein n=1 Tax=unclassified Rhizobacter TaxID=2640088 RepID=UPI0006F2AC30|nr:MULTISPECIES: hypothetical protein [unclassified Rhizobacter]KQU80820.1 hypothetical protein ASC88_14825 [Rhizobacter sp. Root29]KQW04363.1 hypothetical protein ASC98_04515 [Rhizobacter sp. Root1238]KRB14506.1 hypothetical protein ASE08_08625 [Rhizobacter sp. Root16D2]